MPLGIMSSPRARDRLTTYIGRRMFQRWVTDPMITLPPVELVTIAEARRRGVTQPTGWYNFETRSIGLVVDETKDHRSELIRLDATDVHEHAHWLFNEWPKDQDQHGRFLFNVFTDASNEQRVLLEDAWGRKLLRKGRRQRLQFYLDQPSAYRGDTEPLYNAAWLTLAAHTVLMCETRKNGKLTQLEKLYRGKLNAAEVWPAIEKIIGPPDPCIEKEWLDALHLAISAWIIRLTEPQAEFIRQFRALFPEPVKPPMPSIWDIGGEHGPGGGNGNGPLCPATKAGGKIKPAPSQPDSSDPDTDDDEPGEPEDPEDPSDDSPPEVIDISGDGDEDLDDNSTPPTLQHSPHDPTPQSIDDEIRDMNQPVPPFCPRAPVRDSQGMSETTIQPVDPSRALTTARGPAGQLAAQLRITRAPRIQRHSIRGRIDTRVIAREPDAEKPFLQRSDEETNAMLGCYLLLKMDTSGSMNKGNKRSAISHAGLVAHLACEMTKTSHSIVTSRTLRLLAGEGLTLRRGTRFPEPFRVSGVRAHALLASLSSAGEAGAYDDYDITCSIALKVVQQRAEPVKIMLIVTDGGISVESMQTLIVTAAHTGVLVFGVGLDLESEEQTLMRLIFGEQRVVLASSSNFVAPLARTIVAAVRLGQKLVKR